MRPLSQPLAISFLNRLFAELAVSVCYFREVTAVFVLPFRQGLCTITMPPIWKEPETEVTAMSPSFGSGEKTRWRGHKGRELSSPASAVDDEELPKLGSPMNYSPAPACHRQPRRRKHSKSCFKGLCVMAFDLAVLLYVCKSLHLYYRTHVKWVNTVPSPNDPIPVEPDPSQVVPINVATALEDKVTIEKPINQLLEPVQVNEDAQPVERIELEVPSKVLTAKAPMFMNSFIDAPACDTIEAEDVTLTLALQLSDNQLWMLGHHCSLWGVSAPISVAVWTNMHREEILEKIQSMGCDNSNIALQTLSSEGQSGTDYPINQLRNMALSQVATTHVLMLDVDFRESDDLFDILNSPPVRSVLAKDPKLALVVPAFELQDPKCGTSTKCQNKFMQTMPRDFEDLVLELGSHKALPYDATNFALQGSTNYRRWMKQRHGELVDISCVSSPSTNLIL